MQRTKPTARCSNCGRTVALRPRAVMSIKTLGYTGPVVPTLLRPHKCAHGAWCDECRKKHSNLG